MEEKTIGEHLKSTAFDCIFIGAGVRKEPEEFILFEKAINLIHEQVPAARICFNTGPTDSVYAVRR
jgi:hypothetical protein